MEKLSTKELIVNVFDNITNRVLLDSNRYSVSLKLTDRRYHILFENEYFKKTEITNNTLDLGSHGLSLLQVDLGRLEKYLKENFTYKDMDTAFAGWLVFAILSFGIGFITELWIGTLLIGVSGVIVYSYCANIVYKIKKSNTLKSQIDAVAERSATVAKSKQGKEIKDSLLTGINILEEEGVIDVSNQNLKTDGKIYDIDLTQSQVVLLLVHLIKKNKIQMRYRKQKSIASCFASKMKIQSNDINVDSFYKEFNKYSNMKDEFKEKLDGSLPVIIKKSPEIEEMLR